MEMRIVLLVIALVAIVWAVQNITNSMRLVVDRNVETAAENKQDIIRVKSPFSNISPDQQRRKILLVHVGKTGGESVRHTLKITCRVRRNPEQQQICREQFRNETESALSKHTMGTFHCNLLLPTWSLGQSTTLLWTLRSPLDRISSWFHFTNPANCRPLEDYYSTACNTNRSITSIIQKKNTEGSRWPVEFFHCFPTINQFTDALEEDSDEECSSIAWCTIRGQASQTSGHAHYNYEYYWNSTLSRYSEKEVWALRTEYLWEDMQQVGLMLSGDYPSLPQRRYNVTHGSEGHVRRDRLSDHGRENLCCALDKEMEIYRLILKLAANLNSEKKNESLDYLERQCNQTA